MSIGRGEAPEEQKIIINSGRPLWENPLDILCEKLAERIREALETGPAPASEERSRCPPSATRPARFRHRGGNARQDRSMYPSLFFLRLAAARSACLPGRNAVWLNKRDVPPTSATREASPVRRYRATFWTTRRSVPLLGRTT